MEDTLKILQEKRKSLHKKMEGLGDFRGEQSRSIIGNAARRIASVQSRDILVMGLNTYGA